MSIYQDMRDAGVPLSHWQSDLYVPVNEITRPIIEAYRFRGIVTTFVANGDGKLWYDIPFAYDPHWPKGVQS